MQRLSLTSPHMHGADVIAAQKELKQRNWLQGPIDGEFGPDSERATKRAQYYMGFTLKNLNGVYNPYLHSILTDHRDLRPDQQARRVERLKPVQVPRNIKALKTACSYIGYKESPPDSNRTKFSEWYGIIGPWCFMFVTYCCVQVGYTQFVKGKTYAYCPYGVNDALAGKNFLAVTYTPKPGDLVFYDWQSDKVADHVGFYADEANLMRFAALSFSRAKAEFGPLGHNEFWAVEGNTAVGNDSNGGEVLIRKRNKSQVRLFAHAGERSL